MCFVILYEFYVRKTDFSVTIMALKRTSLFAKEMEARVHWLVVSDAFVIITTNNANKLLRHVNLLLLHHLIIADGAERHVRRNNRKLVAAVEKNMDFIVFPMSL